MISMAHEQNTDGFQMTGFSVVLNCNGDREVMIVSPMGCEEEWDVINKAVAAARHGYPCGNIDVVAIRPNQRWFVYGMQADPAGECFWQS